VHAAVAESVELGARTSFDGDAARRERSLELGELAARIAEHACSKHGFRAPLEHSTNSV
jgi:hypothetical protein